MTRNAQDIIDDMRNIVKPRIAKMLLEANFEGCGKEDKAEFETEFEMTLTLAEMALKQESIIGKIRAEIEQEYTKFRNRSDMWYERACGLGTALEIIDKYRKNDTHDKTCVNCFHNYGVRHNTEFNPEDIVCEYWESDGLTKDDFCSRWKDKEEETNNAE